MDQLIGENSRVGKQVSKRILHIVEAAGGVERYLVTLLKKFKDNQQYEHVLVCSSSFDVQKFQGLVSDIRIIDSLHNSISAVDDLKAIVAVRRAIIVYKPAIVYCHSSKGGAIGRIADIGINNKVIYNAHGWSFNIVGIGKEKKLLYEMIERALSHMTDKIVCISEYEKKSALLHKICRADKLTVINNGIDFEEFADLHLKTREELGIPQKAFVVGMIGRLTPQKAPDVFIKMAAEVNKAISDAFFIMVGDDIGGGQFRDKTEEQIKDHGLENNILITGWVSNPLDYLGVFDVAALFSRWEGFGLVLPEYMFMGKPIVATRVDAIPYVLGDAGQLIDVDDYQMAADSVIKMYRDKEYRNRLADIGKKRVQLFNAQRTADEHLAVFQALD